VKDRFVVRDLGELAVKGKALPVKLFAVEDARQVVRVPVRRPVTVTDGELSITAEVMNISRLGVAVRGLPKPIEQGRLVKLRLTLAQSSDSLLLDGRTIWSREDRTGFTFIGMSQGDERMIERLLSGA
jgi:hypothetical protein